MAFLISCCVYALLCFVCAVVFIVLGNVQKNRIVKYYQKRISRARLTEKIIENVKAMKTLEEEGRFDKYPEIHKYLKQNYILLDKMFELSSIEFQRISKVRENIEAKKDFSNELCDCSDSEILTLLSNTLYVLHELFKEQHPYISCAQNIKKTVLCTILIIRLFFVVFKEIIRNNYVSNQDLEKRMADKKDDIKRVVDTSICYMSNPA